MAFFEANVILEAFGVQDPVKKNEVPTNVFKQKRRRRTGRTMI